MLGSILLSFKKTPIGSVSICRLILGPGVLHVARFVSHINS